MQHLHYCRVIHLAGDETILGPFAIMSAGIGPPSSAVPVGGTVRGISRFVVGFAVWTAGTAVSQWVCC